MTTPRSALPVRRLLDRLSAALARLVLAVFFRRVEVEGLEKVPASGPLLVVANHPNGLIDPVVLLGALPRPVRFLGKSTLWDLAPLRPFLALAGVIPVYRPTDPGTDPSKNLETFARCRDALVRDAAVAIFPEGTSHADPSVRPLKTGAARIALDAAHADDRSPEPVRILPVGLTFDARERFRSRALLVVGDPIEVEPPAPAAVPQAKSAGDRSAGEAMAHGRPSRAVVRGLTERIHDGLRRVADDYRSWREAQLFRRAVEIYDRPSRALPGGTALAELHRTARDLSEGFAALRTVEPELTATVARAMARYDRILGFLSLRDDQVAARYPVLGVLRFLARTLLILVLGLPLALLGTALNLLPYLAVRWIAARPALAVEEQASWKLFGGLFLYPACWLLQAVAAGWWAGPAVGLAAAVAAPTAGYVALLLWERGGRLWRESRAFVMLRTRPRVWHRLRAMRRELRRGVERLAALRAGSG